MKVFVFCGTALFLTLSCQSESKSNHTEVPIREKAVVNPNGDSELSLLMRSMTDFMEKSKGNLEKGLDIQDCPEEFVRLSTAKETEGIIRDRNHFNAYSDQWLSDLEKMCSSKGQEQVQAYEQLRVSCLNCHQSYCQGPIPKIQRLTVQNP
jgi:hypothetical protein